MSSHNKTAVELLKKDRIRIGAYGPLKTYNEIQETDIQKLAEAGIDFAIIRAGELAENKKYDVFKWLADNGIEAAVSDKNLQKFYERASLLDLDKADQMWFKDEPSYTYCFYVDEPGIEHFEVLGKEIEKFNKMFPDKKAYVNLLPMYANSAQLSGGAWKAPIEYYEQPSADYRQYLEEYIKHVPTDFISADIYPCKRGIDPDNPDMFPAEYTKPTYADYVKNIELLADACRRSGREMWTCIQTCSWHYSVREPDEADLRWQAYTMLSFGAKAMMYYTFADRTMHTGALINVRGDRTKLFFASKRMCEGLHKLSDIYVQYKNIGAFNLNSTPETTPYLEMYQPYTGFDTISEICCDTPLLVGCFEKKDGNGTAFTLVNMQDFNMPKSCTVRFRANGIITMYYDGEPKQLEAVNSEYTVTLSQGDGVFITAE
ncbi:MAG: hypothetical protein E7588_00455 [Ruminococcaceae bacterium]|nr:hypothetical protein [Oscillospiraceae bacterium]